MKYKKLKICKSLRLTNWLCRLKVFQNYRMETMKSKNMT